MIVINNTNFPDKTLSYLIRFVDPGRFFYDGYDELVLTNQDPKSDRLGLFVPYCGKRYDIRGRDRKIVIFMKQFEGAEIEELVNTLAHEFRHLWQWHHDRDFFITKMRKPLRWMHVYTPR